MARLVLASRSTARARLLAEAGVRFDVQAAEVDEDAFKAGAAARALSPRRIAQELAVAKALDVSRRGEGLVIGADQTLELEGRLFDKPPTMAAAREQLTALRSRTHQLHAAAVVVQGEAVLWRVVGTVTLHVRPFSNAFLDRYLAAEGEALLGCVGAYRLEALGAQLFDHIEGDYFAVLGLPLLPLLSFLRERGEIAA